MLTVESFFANLKNGVAGGRGCGTRYGKSIGFKSDEGMLRILKVNRFLKRQCEARKL